MSSPPSAIPAQIDSDNEVPAVQLCSLPLSELHTLDLSTTQDFLVLLEVLAHGDQKSALTAVTTIRKSLTDDSDQRISDVVEAGGVEILHTAMKSGNEQIRWQAIGAVANLATGTSKQVSRILKAGCVATLVDIVNLDRSWDIKEQALWALGNVAGDSPSCRDRVLEAGAIAAILSHLQQDYLPYMRCASWVLSNLIQGQPPPDHSYFTQVAPCILSLFCTTDDMDIRSDLCSALIDITTYCANSIGLNQKTCATLVQLIDTSEKDASIVRILGNIVALTGEYTHMFIESGLLEKVDRLLRHTKVEIRKQTCWLLRNICTKSPNITDKVILSGLISHVISLVKTDSHHMQKEIVWVLATTCSHCSPQYISELLHIGISKPLIEVLYLEDEEVVSAALQGLIALVEYGKANPHTEALRLFMDVQELIVVGTHLARKGVSAAQRLVRAADWLISVPGKKANRGR